jgi:hypothetical protein
MRRAWVVLGSVLGLGTACGDQERPPPQHLVTQVCAAMSVDQCESNGDCTVIEGRRMDHDRKCLDKWVRLGCRAKRAACGTMWARGEDPYGECWIIATGCIPAGWSFVSESPNCSIQVKACDSDGGQ